MADPYKGMLAGEESTDEGPGFKRSSEILGRGLTEAVPFVGEKIAEKQNMPMPKTFTERLTRRAGRNLPYAVAAAPFVSPMAAGLGFVGSTALGQLAEEVGVPEAYQPIAEIAGQGVGQVATGGLGRTIGYAEKPLVDLYNSAKGTFKLGPGARTNQGMKYGAGDDPVSASQNLTRFTEMATERVGKKYRKGSIDDKWIKATRDDLGAKVKSIFGGKIFSQDPQFAQDIVALESRASNVFGDKGNIVKTILDKNIGGSRPGGSLKSGQFDAMGLRGAIEDINANLANAEGPQARILHETAEALHNFAERELRLYDPKLVKQYQDWRKGYTSFATIEDVYSKEAGRTAAGQIPLDKLHDEIIKRTGQTASHPLFDKLAEFGPLFRGTAPTGKPNIATGTYRAVTESPLSKALQTGLQPSVPRQFSGAAGKIQPYVPAAQLFSPAQQYLQMSADKKKVDPYAGMLKD